MARAEFRLLMIEEAGCIYCQRWKQEVGPEFPITPEGQAAPIKMIDIRSDEIDTYDLSSRPRLTPTFILVQNKVELDRIEGYPGEDFFWGLLGLMLERAEIDLSPQG
ncbi:hypothetical protein JQU17_08725 [Ponticoccus sp. SC2-23]|nr:hypothetical protein [Ponticoccus sp. SC6-9]MBM1224917.1 hypothetical protein [Ponticoccus sp. SC6-15]MBM1228431.1 hypothetical protein [Ponticoccus sp. SC6-38]MBM1233932.1 hypothetical protein [Ponticoccus sp. SC6-45]MBM1238932.1 hypothetical protein [Ponticoccus sp. SC6-49]MBM1242714.1 hypothetical protein [Ponticoccus sp. SC2-64]MBM1247456.1 hypothetical protein [Ponticoccus sp. SC6-42]MBM1251885.1 hypothetical protein [Ponticoccus sp. SC6-33]MBM1256941.1 hypothetical protein [Pontico